MSFPVFNQARDSINKAYVALQNWNTNPADIPLPDVVDTKRSHLTNQQIAARYLKSIEGNPDIDINKLPKMKSRERIDHDLPIVDLKHELVTTKRGFDDLSQINRTRCTRNDFWWITTRCVDDLMHVAKSNYRPNSPLTFELKGSADPDCVCLVDVPRFIICSPKNFEYVHEGRSLLIGEHILDYRNFSELYKEPSGKCSPVWNWRFDCPKPAVNPVEVNQQIDQALNQPTTATILLNQTQLDDYLRHRESYEDLENFTYILVGDNPNFKGEIQSSKPDNSAAIVAGVASLGAAALAVFGVIRYKLRTSSQSAGSTTVMVPTLQSINIETDASQLDGSEANTNIASQSKNTVPLTHLSKTTTPKTTASPSCKSDDAISASIYFPPAGAEGGD